MLACHVMDWSYNNRYCKPSCVKCLGHVTRGALKVSPVSTCPFGTCVAALLRCCGVRYTGYGTCTYQA